MGIDPIVAKVFQCCSSYRLYSYTLKEIFVECFFNKNLYMIFEAYKLYLENVFPYFD